MGNPVSHLILYTLEIMLSGVFLTVVLQRFSKWSMWIGNGAACVSSVFLIVGAMEGWSTSALKVLNVKGVLPFTSLDLRIHAFSALFLLLLGTIGLLATIYGIGYCKEFEGVKSTPLLSAGIQGFIFSMAVVVLAGNVFTFLISWELMSIVSYFLVMFEHEKSEVQRSGFIYIVMTHLGTVFLMVGFFILSTYAHSYSFSDFQFLQMPRFMKTIVFVCAFIGFGTKAGLVPFHIWLPKAHPVAPSHVSALMSGVMIKTAAYGFMLFVFQFLQSSTFSITDAGSFRGWGATVLIFGAITAIYGILYALNVPDFKRMLAYSSIENMGIIFMGFGVSLLFYSYQYTSLASFALLAAMVHLINHVVFKSLLFMGAGAILNATHIKNMDLLGGLIRKMPWTALFVLIGFLSISAMPPFNGFIGEWLLLQSLFSLSTISYWPGSLLGILGLSALVLTGSLVAMLGVRAFSASFLALPRSEYARHAQEVSFTMRVSMAILSLACIVLGIFPSLVIHQVSISLAALNSLLITPKSIPWFMPLQGASHGSQIMSPFAGFVGLIAIGVPWLLARMLGGKTKRMKDETWTCGSTLTSRMTYTATGFTKPIRVVFDKILQPSRQLKAVDADHKDYFVSKYIYKSRVRNIWEDTLYKPAMFVVVWVSKQIRVIQNGHIQTYLVYLFATLLFVLMLVKK